MPRELRGTGPLIARIFRFCRLIRAQDLGGCLAADSDTVGCDDVGIGGNEGGDLVLGGESS